MVKQNLQIMNSTLLRWTAIRDIVYHLGLKPHKISDDWISLCSQVGGGVGETALM